MADVAETVPCRWCKCVDYHSEVCKGFEVNDPANPDRHDSLDRRALGPAETTDDRTAT